jgi:hypothetical protein
MRPDGGTRAMRRGRAEKVAWETPSGYLALRDKAPADAVDVRRAGSAHGL